MLGLQENSGGTRRPAFSLAELVISIGILILMMALAGQVFTITIKSTGQATGLTEVTQQLRVLEETLREDLRNVQPSQSMLLIQGNPVNAYWTQLGKEADDNDDPSDGYGHLRDLERERLKADGTPDLATNGNEKLMEPRADILMFFTARKATSTINPSVSSRVQQVVYAHADMGEYPIDPTADMTPTAAFPTLYPAPDPFLIPAQQWHLARRSILVIPTALTPQSSWETIRVAPPVGGGFGKEELLEGQSDFVSDFRYDDLVVRPNDAKNGWSSEPPWFLPSVFGNTLGVAKNQWHQPYARCKIDATPPMMMANRIGSFFLPNCASFKVEWSLDPSSPFVAGRLDRINEVFWFDPGNTGTDPDINDDDPLHALRTRIQELEKDDDDPCTTVSHPKYQLCQDLKSLLCNQSFHGDDWPTGSDAGYSLADRFTNVACDDTWISNTWVPEGKWPPLAPDGRPNIATFTALRPGAMGGELVPDRFWPGALRITVDLYDREFRLERPIRHVMVIPIGG